MRFYGEIRRVDEEQRMVWGYASTEQRAGDGQVITRAAMEGALDDYMAFANIREMHQPSAAGVAREAHVDEGGLYIGAHVVDDQAWKKVVERVYKGFSVGAKVTARDVLDRSTITGIMIREISLVDRPDDPGAVFDTFRAYGVDVADEDEDETPTPEDDMRRGASKPAAEAAPEAPEATAAEAAAAEAPAAEVERAADAEAGEGEGAAPEPEAAAEPAAEAAAELTDVERAVEGAAAAIAAVDTAVEGVERAAAGEAEAPRELPGAELRRSVSLVSRFGYLLQDLAYLIFEADFEKEIEGDESAVPAALREGLRTLATAYKAMSVEEIDELLANADALVAVERATGFLVIGADEISRATGEAEISAELAGQLQTAFDGFVERGWAPVLPAIAEPEPTELQRLSTDRDTLMRTVGELTTKMEGMVETITRLAAQPVEPRTAGTLARAVDKGEDAAGAPTGDTPPELTADQVQRVLAEMPEAERALLLTRAALSRPLPVTR